MTHESASAGRSEHPQGRHSLPPSRRNDMESDFLPVDEQAWQEDFRPEFQESAESQMSQTSDVDVQTRLFRRQHQFLFELRSKDGDEKLPAYVHVGRSDRKGGYTVELQNADSIEPFQHPELLAEMRAAASSQEALHVLREFFKQQGIDLKRITV